MAKVSILHEVSFLYKNNWQLCFQDCVFYFDNGTKDDGFRFIWRRPNGSLQPARGQARIPSKLDLESLLIKASKEGWYK